MNHRIRKSTRLAVSVMAAVGVAAGAATVGTGAAAADGFPDGPYCYGPAQVLAESNWSQVAICPAQGPTGWKYVGKAKTTGNTIDLWGATENNLGFHVSNNGYTYHVHRDRLLITASDGSTVSNEPWIYYNAR